MIITELDHRVRDIVDKTIVFQEHGALHVAEIDPHVIPSRPEDIQYMDFYRSPSPFLLCRLMGVLCCFDKAKCRFHGLRIMDEAEKNEFLRNHHFHENDVLYLEEESLYVLK